MEVEFPSLEEMFNQTYLVKFKNLYDNTEDGDDEDMHDDFLALLIDTFNLSMNDDYLS